MRTEVITLLTGLLTSGVLMLFIENQHIKSAVYTKYESIMIPFMRKLSNYFKFAFHSDCALDIKNFNNNSVQRYKKRLKPYCRYAHMAIMDARDFPVGYFSAKEIDDLCNEINNVWYFGKDNIRSMEDAYEINHIHDIEIKKDLCIIFPNDKICEEEVSVKLINDVSTKFFSEVYKPIRHIPQNYEVWDGKCSDFRELAFASLLINVLSVGTIIFWESIPGCLVAVLLVMSLLMFCGVLYYLVEIDKLSRKIFK